MYKVVIVEDDRIIRRSLCKAAWEDYDFTVVGQAGNGQQAIEIIKAEKPEVVVSDINMPFMSGLDMAQMIKDKSPHTKVIFLTGYEDFSYAQKAVKLKAFDYLLKPVQPRELMEKAKEAAEMAEQEMIMEKRFEETLPLLQQRFLQKLASDSDRASSIDVEKELDELGIHLEGPYFVAFIIQINSSELTESNRKKVKVLVRDILIDHELQGSLIEADPKELVLFLSLKTENIEFNEMLALQMEERLRHVLNEKVMITQGRVYSNLFEVGTSYLEAKLAMDVSYFMTSRSVYSIDDFTLGNFKNDDILEKLNAQLTEQIKAGLPAKIKETLHHLKRLVKDKDIPLRDLKLLALSYSGLLTYEIRRWRKKQPEKNMFSLYYKILQLDSVEKIVEILENFVDEWSETMQTNREQMNSLVEKAMAHIEKNYADVELTQKKVADEIFVSAPYLSNLFKNELGINFSDYLLEIRMKKAMELLREGAKIYKVAEDVGYGNPQYFSISFKKYTGYTPAEYKKMMKGRGVEKGDTYGEYVSPL